ncbi:hypothetical protein HYQ44_014885 [Verticillium longisporum]|nr:hypothetical protein HYQ44_014885 [Verticillium longisporum]
MQFITLADFAFLDSSSSFFAITLSLCIWYAHASTHSSRGRADCSVITLPPESLENITKVPLATIHELRMWLWLVPSPKQEHHMP